MKIACNLICCCCVLISFFAINYAEAQERAPIYLDGNLKEIPVNPITKRKFDQLLKFEADQSSKTGNKSRYTSFLSFYFFTMKEMFGEAKGPLDVAAKRKTSEYADSAIASALFAMHYADKESIDVDPETYKLLFETAYWGLGESNLSWIDSIGNLQEALGDTSETLTNLRAVPDLAFKNLTSEVNRLQKLSHDSKDVIESLLTKIDRLGESNKEQLAELKESFRDMDDRVQTSTATVRHWNCSKCGASTSTDGLSPSLGKCPAKKDNFFDGHSWVSTGKTNR